MSRAVVMNANLSEPTRSDRDLWHAVGSGDEVAFRELFHRYSRMIYNYCFRRTGTWSLAEDAVQATFATLWRRAVAGKVDELRLDSARPMLLAMARDECHNANRSRSRHVRLIDRASAATGGAADNTAAWVEAETTMRAIRQALAPLPRHQRDVVELVAWSGLSMAEAAATLGISVGTVKSRLSRARSRLANTPIASLLGDSR
jgi:RNA polymerase sigma-70 factor (ECF subfamily)